VITNALNIAMELANLPNVRLIMIGGILRQMSYSLSGPHAEQTLRGLHADRLFLAVDGLDPDIGLMTPDVLEAQLNAIISRFPGRWWWWRTPRVPPPQPVRDRETRQRH
jgi:DeoR family transcriptional regulator of aga operon